MLMLLDKYFSRNQDWGLSPLIYNQVPIFEAIGLERRYFCIDLFESTETLEREFWSTVRGQEIVWISSVWSPLLTRSFICDMKNAGLKIVAVYADMIRIMAPAKKYEVWQKHYWYHDKIHRARRLAKYADVIVAFDWHESPYPEKSILFPTPQPTHIFFPTSLNGKQVDVSFVGELNKADRRRYVQAFPDMETAGGTAGGSSGGRVPLDRYAELMRTSKLSLNVPDFRGAFDQLNGRSFEILSSRTALVQPYGPNIVRFLEPEREFIPLEGPEDLPGKVRYYLDHPDEREEIAYRGWRRVMCEYSAAQLWKAIRERLPNTDS